VRRDIAECLPGGSAQRLGSRLGHLEIAVEVPPHVQFAGDLVHLAPQQRPEICGAGPAAGDLPGQ